GWAGCSGGFGGGLKMATRFVPMTDDTVRTRLRTDMGWLDFQDYFVRRRCAPTVLEVAYDGAARARAHPDALAALRDPRLRAIVICPSNPFLSIEPILAVGVLREAIARSAAPVVAVSPIIAGRAVKGPTGQEDVRAGARGECEGGGTPLPRSPRCLCARPRRYRRCHRAWHSGHAGAYPDGDACGSRGAGTPRARQRRRGGKGY